MNLPQGWKSVSVADVAEAIFDGPFGSALKTADYTDHGVRVARLENIGHLRFRDELESFVSQAKADSLRRHLLARDDVLFSSFVDQETRVCLVPQTLDGRMINKADCFCVRTDRAICDARFLAYKLAAPSSYERFSGSVRGITRPRIGLRDLAAFNIDLPPLAEQCRIVAKLETLFARLAHARTEVKRSPQLLERLKLSILRSGSTGVLTEDWRGSNTAIASVEEMLSGLPAPQQGRGGREATDKIIPGAAGLSINDPGTQLPKGWKWVSLLRIAKQETGHTPSRSQSSYWDGGINWIGIRDAGAHHGRYIESTMQTISEAGLENSSARLLPAGTVCLSRTASVGYVTIMAKSMATSQDFATWTCTEALLPEYLMYALMAEGEDIRRFGMGSTHTTIYFPEIRALHIALPPIAEQTEIVARIKQALSHADRLEAEAARARALLDRLEAAILTKAFKGDLVPQDANDEPASVLLERVKAARAVELQSQPKRGRKAATR
ncbi:restriction endonuclease subunit S [Bradyrhizobium liaoningense]|uniref:restriction endonuclease subunit S n=1 Tax=Bradyrhizobium liaoningense TaxID=43992 RepID=UPI001BACD9A5|nr:restriction endonuclease subunit S [Bradyrhizobium liaoningense]